MYGVGRIQQLQIAGADAIGKHRFPLKIAGRVKERLVSTFDIRARNVSIHSVLIQLKVGGVMTLN